MYLMATILMLAAVGTFLVRPHGPTLHLPKEKGRPAPPSIAMRAPRGAVAVAPAIFDWVPVQGAVSYKVTISDQDAVWPLLVRTVSAPPLKVDPEDTSALAPGRAHLWEVEARAADGTVLASGEATFHIPLAVEPSPP